MAIYGVSIAALGVSAAILAVFLLFTAHKKALSLYGLSILIFASMMTAVFSLTGISPMSGFHAEIRLSEINVVPIVGIVSMLDDGVDFYSVSNVLGNILMFCPIGFFAPLLCKKPCGLIKAAEIGLLTSAVIECTQLFNSRGTDIDDLILNTLGTVLGYAVYAICARILPKLAERIRKNDCGAKTFLFVSCFVVPYLVVYANGIYNFYVYLTH